MSWIAAYALLEHGLRVRRQAWLHWRWVQLITPAPITLRMGKRDHRFQFEPFMVQPLLKTTPRLVPYAPSLPDKRARDWSVV